MPPRRKMSKHDDPNSELVFRNWIKELDELMGTLPKGVECVAIGCENKPSNRGAFLCVECGKRYLDVYKDIISPTEIARAQFTWIKRNVLAEDVE